jgi:hypothetical protein
MGIERELGADPLYAGADAFNATLPAGLSPVIKP